MIYNIIGNRIIVTPIDINLGQYLIHSLSHSDDEWPPNSLRALLPFYLERLGANESELGFGPWVIKNKQTQAIMGTVGFDNMPNKKGVVEIGYHIINNYRNQGYATEAVDLLCHWAFDKGVKIITACCQKENKPSQMVLLKNEFRPLSKANNHELVYFNKFLTHNNLKK